MSNFIHFKPKPPEPKPEIKHNGDIPKSCECGHPATRFIVRHTPTNASAAFHCDPCFERIHREYFPDGEPQEPM